MKSDEALQQFDQDQKNHLLGALTGDLGVPDEGMWQFMYGYEDDADAYKKLAKIEEDIEALQAAAALKKQEKSQHK